MAREINKLSSQAVRAAKGPGRLGDGGGLYLQISKTGGKSWLFRYMRGGAAHEMGLGPLQTVSLADARIAAGQCRSLRLEGKDPMRAREKKVRAAIAEEANAMTFAECAEEYIKAHEPGWANPKHRQQWRNTLKTYAYPKCGDVPVRDIDLGHVRAVLDPIWRLKNQTAARVRGRIEKILDWAKVLNHRSGENPALWRGNLQSLLPSPARIKTVGHHPALPYARMADFMMDLRDQKGSAAQALELLILTATRTSEVLNATWGEVNFEEKMWIVPAGRMKGRREHRVPLSPAAIRLLREVRRQEKGQSPKTRIEHSDSDWIFPGHREKRPLSNMALLQLLKRMGRTNITPHGFRSSFRDWGAEQTRFSNEELEMALAHIVSNQVEAAYRRGDMLEKRQKLMAEWARYCTPRPRLTVEAKLQICS